jgi:16S rRNA processing protein RimM
VRRVHGVRGEVQLQALGGDAARFRGGTAVYVEDSRRPLTLRSARRGPEGSVLVGFEGVDTPEQAAQLRGAYLCVDVAAARRLGPDEWFVWQLVGMRCLTEDGAALGTVVDVEEAPAADVLVIEAAGSQLRYPMVREFVRHVDVDAGVITIAPQPEEAS